MTAASTDITMPQLGETVTEGTVIKWFKAVGDAVAEDEALFEVSTDKVDTEVPAAAGGYLTEILVAEGVTVDVGTRLAVISAGAPGDAAAHEGASDAPLATASAPSAPNVSAAPSPNAPEPTSNTPGAAPATSNRRLSPLVRRLLSQHGLDAASIVGSGDDGRVTRADVMGHVAASQAQAATELAQTVAGSAAMPPRPTAAPAATSSAQGAARALPAPAVRRPRQGDHVVPFSNIRRRTAEHMIKSQATAAHVLVVIEVDFDNVDRARLAQRADFKAEEGFSLTYLPFVVRACIDALGEFPNVNASVGNNELVVHESVHLGIAVDLAYDGLIVPVIHDADTKRLRPIAREIADLAARARGKALNADEIAGGTFTITNPGSYGTFITAPVINQPQVAILSTDGVRKKPVVVTIDGSDAIAIHPVGMLALSFDHRAFDGAYASAFLACCRTILETHNWAQEL